MDEKELKQRRMYPPLMALLAAKKFENGLMKLALKIAQGDFNPEGVYNELTDLEKERTAATDAANEKIMKVLYKKHCEDTGEMGETYRCHDFESWTRRVQMRRSEKRRLERQKAEQAVDDKYC